MGCDIHTRVEYLDRNGNWLSGDLFRLNPYFSAEDPDEIDPYTVVEVCNRRNYELFATLADVRNYNDLPYIDQPRGIPDDACARTRRDFEAWGCDAHSESWFTLKELIDWNKSASSTVKRSGYVSPEDSALLDLGEKPKMWCGYTTREDWVYREWEEDYKPLDRMISELKRRGEDLWLWFSDETAEERAENLRIIFWFDN